MKIDFLEILETDPNKKGDLFGRLMGDLFHSLGYGKPRFNVHKSGREIDLTAMHRIDNRLAIAECKAQKEKVGGADINKFVGAFDVEKRTHQDVLNDFKLSPRSRSYNGYFISLSGFRETAIEQEQDAGGNRVILLPPEKIVNELVEGKILVPFEYAVSKLQSSSSEVELMEKRGLFAYDRGWVWVAYFSDNGRQSESHFALIHAEGKPLVKNLAEEIISLDLKNEKRLVNLSYLSFQICSSDPKKIELEDVKKNYFKYLESECGEIYFEGLPTDKDAGSVKVRLENIFVPLHLSKIGNKQAEENEAAIQKKRFALGSTLLKENKLAILANPGCGKSTLIKRLAIAYAFPSRLKEINDSLPDERWVPIFIRCRDLGENVTSSIIQIIQCIHQRAEMSNSHEAFFEFVSNSLQNGTALLLIDGLDEISEDRKRLIFVNQLRTFNAIYPSVKMIITSREAGFHLVAGSLAGYCQSYRISALNDNEIEALSVKWHKSIIDETQKTIEDAKNLSSLIVNDVKLKQIAGNPLLLTTLLFVKRWAGYLPTRKSVLYQEMIKLLLVTWNVQGHDQIDLDEAEPQLAFVAYWMMQTGNQKISEEDLKSCLIDARKDMPEILSYTQITPSAFIRRVEMRSSLLIMSGHKRSEHGVLTQIYEFLHLSFQEYLTAKAIEKKFLPTGDADKDLIELIKPHLDQPRWKEVIPLLAVLLERNSKVLINFLLEETKTEIALSKTKGKIGRQKKVAPSDLLASCLANEVQISPILLVEAFESLGRSRSSLAKKETQKIIIRGKFGKTYKETISKNFFEKCDDSDLLSLGGRLGEIFIEEVNSSIFLDWFSSISICVLSESSKKEKCTAILGLMIFSFLYKDSEDESEFKDTLDVFKELLNLIKTGDKLYRLTCLWALVWAENAGLFPDELRQAYVDTILPFWLGEEEPELHRITSWSLVAILRPDVSTTFLKTLGELNKTIIDRFSRDPQGYEKRACIYLSHLAGDILDNDVVLSYIKSDFSTGSKRAEKLSYPTSYQEFIKSMKIKIPEKRKRSE